LAAIYNCMFQLRGMTLKSPPYLGVSDNVIGPTNVLATWNLNSSSDFSRVHKCDEQTDRQTADRENA